MILQCFGPVEQERAVKREYVEEEFEEKEEEENDEAREELAVLALESEWIVAGGVGSVEVNILPPAVSSLPDPGLLGLSGLGDSLLVKCLSDLDIPD
jgi:hypothetical protein